ncbi:MAG: hypothetical protein ACREI7_04700, partial [Myxococcota bacterium]
MRLPHGSILLATPYRRARDLPREWRRSLLLAVAIAAAFLLLAALTQALHATEHIARYDARIESAVAPHVDPGVVDAARVLTFLGGIYVMSLAFLALFVGLAAKRRWGEAYVTLFAGPGLVGVVLLAKWAFPRDPPLFEAAPYTHFTGFPNETAALVASFAGLCAWLLLRRGRPSEHDAAVLAFLATVAALLCISPFLAGAAWPSDVLAGTVLGSAMLGLCVLGHDVVTRVRRRTELDALGDLAESIHAARATVSGMLARLFGSRRILWALLLAGIAVRISSYWTYELGTDANRYAVMGESFVRDGTFTMPWGDVYSPGGGAEPSHHYPPAYPVYLALLYALFGFSPEITHVGDPPKPAAARVHRAGRRARGPRLPREEQHGRLLPDRRPRRPRMARALSRLARAARPVVPHRDRPLRRVRRGGGYRNWRLFGAWSTSEHVSQAYAAALREPVLWALTSVLSFLFLLGIGYL